MVYYIFQSQMLSVRIPLAVTIMAVNLKYNHPVFSNFQNCRLPHDPLSVVGDLCRIFELSCLFIQLNGVNLYLLGGYA